MRKRILSVILTLCLLCALLPAAALSASAEKSGTDIAYPVEGGNIYFDKTTGTITDCETSVTKADIPAEIDGVPVTRIDRYAFYDCSSLRCVTIPDSVTEIEEGAFSDCSKLSDINIPDSVTHIAPDAFKNTAIYNTADGWADGVLYLGHWLIQAEDSVAGDYVIAAGTIGIADLAFAGCAGLTSVTIPEGVTSIGSYAFNMCSGLTCVTIPNSMTSIAEGAFVKCCSLTEIGVAADNTTYASENGVLFDRSKTALLAYPAGKPEAEFVLPDGVTRIGACAFSDCGNLTRVTIPDSVTSIGNNAFGNCCNLTGISIPDSVISIGNHAFAGCGSLTDVKIGNGVTSIGEFVFGWSGLTRVTIPDSVTSIGVNAFYGCDNLTSVTIPDSVTCIEEMAFADCGSLTDISIPSSVTSVGQMAFRNTAISESQWSNGVLYLDNWLLGVEENVSGDCVIRSGTIGIADQAFCDCSNLTSVTIPDSVMRIGEGAFSTCSGLTSVAIPDSVTSIGEGAFSSCSGLTSVTIPDSVTSIGDGAFYDCQSLTSVTIGSSVTSIGAFAFDSCSSLTAIDVAAGNTEYSSVDGVLFNKEISNLIIYPAGKTETEYRIPDSVTGIGDEAFAFCGLKSVTIPDSVTSIGNWAFSYCYSLTSVTIPNSVTHIGEYAFCDCSSLTSVYFEGNAPKLGESVFHTWSEEMQDYDTNPDFTLYYIDGKDGWTSPTWNDYPTATWDGGTGDTPRTHSYIAVITTTLVSAILTRYIENIVKK